MISDKDLRDAARAYEKAVITSLREQEEESVRFSPAFARKMNRLIFRVDHPVRYWLRRLLPLLLLLLLLAGLAAYRLTPQEEEPAVEPSPAQDQEPGGVVYRPTWLPEGCELDRESFYEDEAMLVYRTAGGAEAVFLYAVLPPEEPGEGKAVSVAGWPGVLCLGQSKGELNDLFWDNGGFGLSFWLSAPFPEEDMLRVAESVEAQEAEPGLSPAP